MGRERDQRRRLGDVADDPDPFECEAGGDRCARTLEHGARPELASRQRPRKQVEGLELDVRLGFHVTSPRDIGSRSHLL